MLSDSQLFSFYTCYKQLWKINDNQKKKGLSAKRKNAGEYLHSTDSDSLVEVSFLEILSDFNNFIISCLFTCS